MVSGYMIIQETNIGVLEITVRGMLANNWHLYGTPLLMGDKFVQAMVQVAEPVQPQVLPEDAEAIAKAMQEQAQQEEAEVPVQ